MSGLNSCCVLKNRFTTVPKLITQPKTCCFKMKNLPTTVTKGMNSIIVN